MMDERIVEHLKLLCKYLGYLQMLSLKAREEFLTDITLRGASERYLQVAIESCLNIGGRILAVQQTNPEITAPENYADIFIKLGKLGVLPQSFALKLVNMAKFRNKLVHGYWELVPEKVYDILQENLNDLAEFKQYIVSYLKKEA